MKGQAGLLLVLLTCCVCVVCDDSRGLSGSGRAAEGDQSAIYPTLKPESDKKFFGKDYPLDQRPKVDVLHFKHPYPAVQDSDDFDADYVKDENSDNGYWKAQSEYDRLRHKLAKEKADIAKALAAKRQAEKDLQDAMRREADAKKKLKVAKKKVGSVDGSRGETEEEHHHEVKEKKPERPRGTPGGVAAPGQVDVATAETQKAMDALEECKRQLAEAREKLKKLMKELEEAKERQRETQAALDAAIAKQKAIEASQAHLDGDVKKEYKEYQDAREEYLKQQALVAKMEQDIKAAAAKVKAMRDAEDKNGGVYNTPSGNSARFRVRPLFAFVVAVITTTVLLAH